jgi:cobalt-zinc-cadmium efflux system outer membrane protein
MGGERSLPLRGPGSWATGAIAGLALLLGGGGPARAQAPPAAVAGAPLSLADLERLALERNPTLPQARAAARAAAGRLRQAGLYPNPLVGYELEDLNTREPGRHKNFFWLQVPIVLGGKLAKSEALASTDRAIADTTVEVQRLRVLATVRLLYYEALGLARLVAMREELLANARAAVETTEELFNVGQADRPDILEVQNEASRAALELVRTRNQQARVWRALAAAVGRPDLPPAPLAGSLDDPPPPMDPQAVMARVLRESPEVRIARTGLERARAALERVRAERIPNMFVRTKMGYNAERFERGGDVGFEAGVEVGIPLPLFDRQQGNLAAAEADLEHARREVERLELELRTQLGVALRSYEDARAEVEQYRDEVVPRAEEAVGLYRRGFEQMTAAYPQVLIAQRSLFQARAEYVQALVELWRSAAVLDGMLLVGGLEAPFHTSVQLPPPTGHIPSPAGRPAD